MPAPFRDVYTLPRKTAFIYSDEFLSYNLGPRHPLQQRRLRMVYELLNAYGALAPNGPIDWLPPRRATEAEVLRVHTADYVEAVRRASHDAKRSGLPGLHENPPSQAYLSRYGIGPGDTPAFPGMDDAAALYAGGTIQAAELVASGEYGAVFNVAGGLHHAHPDHASGFCTFNDLAMGINVLLDRGFERVAYIDIDAHHGDGTQACFYDDGRVLTISLHQTGLFRFYPGTGFPYERGEGAGLGTAVNLPFYPFTEDDTWHEGFDAVVPDALKRFDPQAIVLQVGADAHHGDPLTRLMLSSRGWMRAFDKLLQLSEGLPLVVTGGGGYNLRTVARLWTMVTARCAGVALPETVPAAYADKYEITDLWGEDGPPVEADVRQTAHSYMLEQVALLKE